MDEQAFTYSTVRAMATLAENTHGRIYFVQSNGEDGPVKIGYTANDAMKRVAELASGSPYETALLLDLPGDRALEKALHKRFAADRIRGEWFRLSDCLRWFIITMQQAQAAA